MRRYIKLVNDFLEYSKSYKISYLADVFNIKYEDVLDFQEIIDFDRYVIRIYTWECFYQISFDNYMDRWLVWGSYMATYRDSSRIDVGKVFFFNSNIGQGFIMGFF